MSTTKDKVQYTVKNTGDKLGIKSLIKGTTPTPIEEQNAKNDSNSSIEEDVSPTNSVAPQEEVTEKSAPLSYSDMRKRFEEELKKGSEELAKKARRDKIFAKLSDGISAIANLVATTKGAQSSYTGDNTRTENTRKRWEDYYNRYIKEQKERYKDMEDAMRLDEAIRYRNEEKEKEDEHNTNKSILGQPIQRESDFNEEEKRKLVFLNEFNSTTDKEERIKLFEDYVIENEKRNKQQKRYKY